MAIKNVVACEYKKFVNGNKLELMGECLNAESIIEKLLPFLEQHPEITELSLFNNGIYDAEAIALATNKTLKSLNLSKNYIADQGATALAGNQTLRSLNLSNNNVHDDGAKALAGNQTLSDLNLIDNYVSRCGLAFFYGNQTLLSFKVFSDGVSGSNQRLQKVQKPLRIKLNRLLEQNSGFQKKYNKSCFRNFRIRWSIFS